MATKKMHKIIFFPDYTAANPYQALLYSNLSPHFFAEFGKVEHAISVLNKAGPSQRTIFHLHWDDAVYRNAPDRPAALKDCQSFLDSIQAFVAQGGLLLWTIHNAAPHDPQYHGLHTDLRTKLADLSHFVHLHSYVALEQIGRQVSLAPEKIIICPHGNFLPVYPEANQRLHSRTRPTDGGTQFLFFGRVSRYKGLAQLIEALGGLQSLDWSLVVAGARAKTAESFVSGQFPAERLTIRDGFVPEDQVAEYFARGDFVVLPYAEILTSGSLMLAMTFGRPVIAPRLATLEAIVQHERNALLYRPGDMTDLRRCLSRAAAMHEHDWSRFCADAAQTARRYDWRVIGGQFSAHLFRAIAEHAPADKAPRRLP